MAPRGRKRKAAEQVVGDPPRRKRRRQSPGSRVYRGPSAYVLPDERRITRGMARANPAITLLPGLPAVRRRVRRAAPQVVPEEAPERKSPGQEPSERSSSTSSVGDSMQMQPTRQYQPIFGDFERQQTIKKDHDQSNDTTNATAVSDYDDFPNDVGGQQRLVAATPRSYSPAASHGSSSIQSPPVPSDTRALTPEQGPHQATRRRLPGPFDDDRYPGEDIYGFSDDEPSRDGGNAGGNEENREWRESPTLIGSEEPPTPRSPPPPPNTPPEGRLRLQEAEALAIALAPGPVAANTLERPPPPSPSALSPSLTVIDPDDPRNDPNNYPPPESPLPPEFNDPILRSPLFRLVFPSPPDFSSPNLSPATPPSNPRTRSSSLQPQPSPSQLAQESRAARQAQAQASAGPWLPMASSLPRGVEPWAGSWVEGWNEREETYGDEDEDEGNEDDEYAADEEDEEDGDDEDDEVAEEDQSLLARRYRPDAKSPPPRPRRGRRGGGGAGT